MSSDEHKKIVEQWMYEVFAQGNISLLDQLFAPDFISTDPSGKIGAQSFEQFKQWLHWYRSSFTDAQWHIHEILESGENVVVRYSGETTHQGGLLAIPTHQQRVLPLFPNGMFVTFSILLSLVQLFAHILHASSTPCICL